MKFYLKLLVALLLLWGGGRLYYRLTDGFRMGNVTLEMPFKKEWELPLLSAEERSVLEEALNQSYHYLDKGHQAYVFESQDKRFVLKLLKFQRVRIPHWLRETSLPFSWEEWRVKRIAKKDRMLQQLLTSWKLAFEELKQEAAIVYVHINPSQNLQKKLILRDKIGLKHTLELDETVFLIQRKAGLLEPTINQLMAEKKEQEAKQILKRIVALFTGEYRRGLAEKELFILRNTGILDGQPIHIDTGRFEWDPELKNPVNYRVELRRKTGQLREWLQQRHPGLSEYFEALL